MAIRYVLFISPEQFSLLLVASIRLHTSIEPIVKASEQIAMLFMVLMQIYVVMANKAIHYFMTPDDTELPCTKERYW